MARKFVRVRATDTKQLQDAALERSAAAGVDQKKVDLEQAQAVEDIAPDSMRTRPAEAFDPADPEAYPVWHGASGFVENLDNPMVNIKEQSLPANLIKWLSGKTNEAVQLERNKYRLDPNVSAINKELGALEDAGQIDTPEYAKLMDELAAVEADLMQSDKDPEFSFAAVQQSFKKDPEKFFAEFANAIATDPELLITPIGWRAAATRAGAAVSKLTTSTKAVAAAEVAGGAGGTAALGGGISAAIGAGEQLGEKGEITDPEAIQLDAELGAAASVILVGAFKGLERGIKGATGKAGKAAVETVSEPVETLVKSDRTLRLTKSPDDELAREIAALEKVVAEDAIAAEHGARVEVLQGVDLGEDILKNLEKEIGFQQIESMKPKFVGYKPARNTMEQAFYDALHKNKQSGKASVKTLAATSFIGLGAAIGAGGADDPLVGALSGAGASVAAILAGRTIKKLGEGTLNAYRYVTAPDNRIRIDHLTNQWEGDIAVKYRASWQVKNAIIQDVPDIKRREAITHFLEGDTSIKLSAKEKAVAKDVRYIFDNLGKEGKDAGVLESFLDNFVPHFWRQKSQTKSEIIRTLSERMSQTGGMGTKTIHAKKRIIPTMREGLEAGLEAQTLDIAEIVKMYDDSLYRAIRNKQLAEAIRAEIAPDGTPLVLSVGDKPTTAKGIAKATERLAIAQDRLERIRARVDSGKSGNIEAAMAEVKAAENALKPVPPDYVPINHPQFMGSVVHPDIAPSLNFIYHSSDPNVIMRGVLALNFAMKRSLVSMSFFHANALLESNIYAGVSPHKSIAALHQLAQGKAGDIVDDALRAGLKIGVIEDVGSDAFYAALKDLETIANDILPVAGGAAVRGVEKLNKVVDKVMWDKIATGGKLAVFMHEMEKALLNNAAKHAKDPKKFPLVPREVLAENVADYVNDAFGGLNWRRIAEGVKSKMGRDIALAAFNPGGRRVMQLLMFAPDWTIANIRVLLKAIPGVAKNKRVARMHQYYAARGALFFATAGSAINMMYTGKPMWENDDPFSINMGDGRRMTFSKQFVEPFHWVQKSGETAINKMGILPKTALELGKGVRYFSGRSSDPPLYADDAEFWEKRYAQAGLIAKKFTPIFAQQVADQGVSGFAGFLGHPIYGKKQE